MFHGTSNPYERWNIALNDAHFRTVVAGNELLNNIPVPLPKKNANRADDYSKRSEAHLLSAL